MFRPLTLAQRTPVYRSRQGLIGAVPIGITWYYSLSASQWDTRPNGGKTMGGLGLRTAEMALAGDSDAPPTRRIEAASATCINAPIDPPSTHKDGLLANPIREGAARPLPVAIGEEGNGRRRRVGIKGRSERALTPRGQCAKFRVHPPPSMRAL